MNSNSQPSGSAKNNRRDNNAGQHHKWSSKKGNEDRSHAPANPTPHLGGHATAETRNLGSWLDRQETELEDQALRLTEALDEERKLAGLQRQFVSMVSHEFRTPLAIIDGSAQRILRRANETVPERAVSALGKIRNSVKRLTELMESVLATARLEDGQIEFSPGPCALSELIQETARNYGELYPDHEIILGLDRLPDQIIADDKLLRQVFSNLISNAVKYSPEKTRVWVNGFVGDDGDIVVTVRDEGVGIPLAEQEQLFDRFFRASTSTGIAGSGIGLQLVLHLIQMHQGEVNVESVEGQGTTFEVRLPAEQALMPNARQHQSVIVGRYRWMDWAS